MSDRLASHGSRSENLRKYVGLGPIAVCSKNRNRFFVASTG